MLVKKHTSILSALRSNAVEGSRPSRCIVDYFTGSIELTPLPSC
jgi:hypothetical protein